MNNLDSIYPLTTSICGLRYATIKLISTPMTLPILLISSVLMTACQMKSTLNEEVVDHQVSAGTMIGGNTNDAHGEFDSEQLQAPQSLPAIAANSRFSHALSVKQMPQQTHERVWVGNGNNVGASENYDAIEDRGIVRVAEQAVSTFSIDVDSGAYSNVRRFINNGMLPPTDAVRAEELINYFNYDYPLKQQRSSPFSVTTELSSSPWNADKHLLHIGLQAYDSVDDKRPASNLVFLLDVSGSMNHPDKLGLLKTSLKLLSQQLTVQDRVSIVVYAGASGVVLEPTQGNQTRVIATALDSLTVGGSTNGVAGIQLAYALAQKAFIHEGINRVILATDGDFNVGQSSVAELKQLIKQKRKSGISLTTLGFGSGNYNDAMMEQLADTGNGNYAYIDNINEARKVLVDELSSTLVTVAKDVKIQLEFNPAIVAEYRLIGYDNRALRREDFSNDKVDAGEIGVGHSVTAIYEISLVSGDVLSIDPLRYGDSVNADSSGPVEMDEMAYVKLRYKAPDSDVSTLLEKAILVESINDNLSHASDNYRFSAAVAGFAQLLRDGDYLTQGQDYSYDDIIALAITAKGNDHYGYRSEFINLVRTAQVLAEAQTIN